MNSNQLRLRWINVAKEAPKYLETYATVAERLAQFWMEHPLGKVKTEHVILTSDDKVYVYAEVHRWGEEDKKHHLLASGQAEEIREGYINEAAAVENCETSAVGRALALAGYGIRKGIASQEEIELAERRRAARASSSANGDRHGETTGAETAQPEPSTSPEVSAPESEEVGELVKQIVTYCGDKSENPSEFAVRREFVRAKLMSLGVDNPIGVRESVLLLTEENRAALREWLQT